MRANHVCICIRVHTAPEDSFFELLVSQQHTELLFYVLGRKTFLPWAKTIQYFAPPKTYSQMVEKSFSLLFNWHVKNLGDDDRKTALFAHVFSELTVKNIVVSMVDTY
jgi:hypothetical protein